MLKRPSALHRAVFFYGGGGIDVRQIFYIDTNKKGNLPPRVVGLVMEWAELHKDELLNNWNSLTETGNYSKIAPLV